MIDFFHISPYPLCSLLFIYTMNHPNNNTHTTTYKCRMNKGEQSSSSYETDVMVDVWTPLLCPY